MGKVMRCYFAHPIESRGTPEEAEIIEELNLRRVVVHNPFDGEDEMMLEKYGRTKYYPDPPFELGIEIWMSCLRQVARDDMIVVYVPDGERLSGGVGIEMFHAWQMKKFIQIISKDKHPSIAYVLKHSRGGQLFNSIEDWKNQRQARWD